MTIPLCAYMCEASTMFTDFMLISLIFLFIYLIFDLFLNLSGYAVPSRIIILINGKKAESMTNVNADKNYSISFQGQDADGNAVALPPGAVTLSLSDDTAGVITTEVDGSYSFNPNKVGPVTLNAASGGLLGSLDIQIEAGALFKIGVSLTEK